MSKKSSNYVTPKTQSSNPKTQSSNYVTPKNFLDEHKFKKFKNKTPIVLWDYNLPNKVDPNNLKTIEEKKKLQESLNRIGYNVGKVDGIIGSKTLKAIEDYNSRSTVDVNSFNSAKDLQKFLINEGYDLGKHGKNKDGVDGIIGSKTKKALEDYNSKLKSLDSEQKIFPSDSQDLESKIEPDGYVKQIINSVFETPILVTSGINKEIKRNVEDLLGKGLSKITDQSYPKKSIGFGTSIRDEMASKYSSPAARSFSLMLSDALGNTSEITENTISEDGKYFLQHLAKKLGPGRHALGGNYEKIYGISPGNWSKGKDAKGKDLDPVLLRGAQEISTKAGQFIMDVDETGNISIGNSEQYNFNAADEDKTINNKKALTKSRIKKIKNKSFLEKIKITKELMDNQDNLHDSIRYGVAPVWNSTEGEGSFWNVKIPSAEKGGLIKKNKKL